MNLGKLVPLEVHGMLGNAKREKKILSYVINGACLISLENNKVSNKLKNTPIGYLVREIRP